MDQDLSSSDRRKREEAEECELYFYAVYDVRSGFTHVTFRKIRSTAQYFVLSPFILYVAFSIGLSVSSRTEVTPDCA